MSAVVKKKMSEEEYLAQERVSAFKSEFFRGEVLAMVGGSIAHNRIIENLSVRIGGALWGSECQTFSSDQRVKIDAASDYVYPDLVVVCGKPMRAESDPEAITNPVTIFEVLSPSTESYDRVEKFEQYPKILTLREYVTIAQDRVAVEQFVRTPDGEWTIKLFTLAEGEFQLASLSMPVKLSDVYSGVEFPEPKVGLKVVPQSR